MAYSTGLPAVSSKAVNVTSAVSDFDAVIDRVDKCAARLSQIHDRLHGPCPQEVANNPDRAATPVSVIGEINIRRSRLVDIINQMEFTINGIETGI